MKGFITDDGNYGVFPFGKKWMVIYCNQQLDVFNTQLQCKKFIKTHQDTLKTVTPSKPENKNSSKIKRSTASKTIKKK